DVPIRYYLDSFGNVCGRLTAPPGGITFKLNAAVRDSGLHDPGAHDAQQLPIDQFADKVLLYVGASRYCETDRLSDIAWSLFKDTRPDWERVQAINDFVNGHVKFGYEHARPTKSALDVYNEKQGVCRDFAHLAVTLCRCMNIPA